MNKKIIVTENMAKKALAMQMLQEGKYDDIIKDRDFIDDVVKQLKDNDKLEKELEKKMRKSVAKCINALFKMMWERNSFWTSTIENA